MNKIWKDYEKNFIKDNANIMKDAELAMKLSKITGRHVSLQAVRKQRQKMGITKIPGRGKCGVVGQKKDDAVQYDPKIHGKIEARPARPEDGKP